MNKNLSKKSNLYNLMDCTKPNYFKEIFPYSEIPKVTFNNINYPMNIPEDIWITDTTFRDGQQSLSSFTVEQITTLYDYLHKLDNKSGIIRQTEFFLYSKKDQMAVSKCMEKGYKFPQITSWIRAKKEDLNLVKEMGIKETGMLMSCSDYHIFKKLKVTRAKAIQMYLDIAEKALENDIIPRCHLEDITRADFYGFVVPLVNKLMELSSKHNMKVKIRACDTLGLGISYSGVELPRSIPAIMYGLKNECGVPSEWIEWHGHNDFYSVVTNSVSAWVYGASSINTTLFGIGERTGNCPLEAMLIEYAQIKGNLRNVDLRVLPEIAKYFQKETNYKIHPQTPFVGSEFNVTKAGIHADGILKDVEIYNAFDTDKILNRPIVVAVNQYSGLAGIAAWINTYFELEEVNKISKNDSRINPIKKWIDEQYLRGRTTVISNDELKKIVFTYFPDIMKTNESKAI
ncbi:beta/alpha barrel domain-containing protein [Tepidibacter formicigenes]|jgi:isopropylmalate/homocitrate/citramalate synthase|uniref:Isopropylmalate/homocitrate/citramalate synthases n=1 Tax=Tepidibacter formicigenes DSM 15518 TaxID=1123349 RepID=A0A1M6M2L2_9FIRM|nr:2-isopropylmalate synthase [Tepidibacter formicigenes]SHJ77708.1 Isopropylmalate/homocitrate/citramalate synthases [Tepidibacter formicigenes DSM 15518]